MVSLDYQSDRLFTLLWHSGQHKESLLGVKQWSSVYCIQAEKLFQILYPHCSIHIALIFQEDSYSCFSWYLQSLYPSFPFLFPSHPSRLKSVIESPCNDTSFNKEYICSCVHEYISIYKYIITGDNNNMLNRKISESCGTALQIQTTPLSQFEIRIDII